MTRPLARVPQPETHPRLFEAPCAHPPARLFCGVVQDPMTGQPGIWVACCACGELLKSGYSEATLKAVGEA